MKTVNLERRVARELKLTSEVAAELNVNYFSLFNCIRHRRIARPAKSASGEYLWSEVDIEAAKQAFARLRQRRQKKAEKVA